MSESKSYELSLPNESRDAWGLWMTPTKKLWLKQPHGNQRYEDASSRVGGNEQMTQQSGCVE